MEDEKYPSKLTKGSKYRIISRGGKDEQIVSVGEFIGYTQFGQDSGVCIKLQSEDKKMDGLLRIIPSMAVLIIDVLDYKHEEDRQKKQPDSIFYN
jgi:hypothetical protein